MSSEMGLAVLWVLINVLAVIVLGIHLDTPDAPKPPTEDCFDVRADERTSH